MSIEVVLRYVCRTMDSNPPSLSFPPDVITLPSHLTMCIVAKTTPENKTKKRTGLSFTKVFRSMLHTVGYSRINLESSIMLSC